MCRSAFGNSSTPLFAVGCLILICSMCLPSNSVAQEPKPELKKVESEPEPVEIEIAEEEDEDEPVQAQVNQIAQQIGIEPGKLIAAKRFLLLQVFTTEIELIERICEPNKKQLLKLKIASKGATKKITKKWQKNFAQGFGGGMGELKAKDGAEEFEYTDGDQIDEMTMQYVTMDNMSNPFNVELPTNNALWKKTIASTLTSEQSQKLKNYQTQRQTLKRNAIIESSIINVAVELGLSDEQIGKLRPLMTKEMKQAKISCPAMYEPYVMMYYASKVSSVELKKLLSPAQHQRWKMHMGPAKQIGQMMEMQNEVVADPVQPEIAGVQILVLISQALEDFSETLEYCFRPVAEVIWGSK